MATNNPFETFPILETKRLILREITIADSQAIFDMRSNARVNQYIGRKAMHSLSESEDLINKTTQAYQQQKALPWAIIRKGHQSIMGTCGLTSIDHKNASAEIGGEAAPMFWGKKYAIEAMSAIINYGFRSVKLNKIIAKFDSENRPVLALMEQLGFQLIEKLPSHFEIDGIAKDLIIFELEPKNFKTYKS